MFEAGGEDVLCDLDAEVEAADALVGNGDEGCGGVGFDGVEGGFVDIGDLEFFFVIHMPQSEVEFPLGLRHGE